MKSSTATTGMIFVCGCGHSGTSLITAMLGAHSRIYSIPTETQIFMRPHLSDADIRNEMVSEYMPFVAAKGADRLCEKTPSHLHYIARIREVFETARIVIPVRDPRDVALSIKLRTGDLKLGYERWIRDNTIVLRQLESQAEDTLIFRYEDLIDDLEATLRQVCAHVGVDYETEMLQYHRDQRAWFGSEPNIPVQAPDAKDHVNLRNWQIKQPVMDRRGRWKSHLSPDEISTVQAACESLMSALGYDPSA